MPQLALLSSKALQKIVFGHAAASYALREAVKVLPAVDAVSSSRPKPRRTHAVALGHGRAGHQSTSVVLDDFLPDGSVKILPLLHHLKSPVRCCLARFDPE